MAIRNGLLALAVSVALHAALVGSLWLLPGRPHQRTEGQAPGFYQAGESPPAVMTFLVSGTTDVMPLTPAPPTPKAAPPATVPPEPKGAVSSLAPVLNHVSADGGPDSSPSGGGESGSPGAGGSTTFFQVPARGLTIVYLIDGSASMGPKGALARARRELLASLQRLPAAARFQIIVYNDSAQPLLPRFQHWLTPDPETFHQIQVKLNELHAEGGTDHAHALYRALVDSPDVLYFLTDADDLDPKLLGEITRRNQRRTAIHVIELKDGSPSRSDRLLQLARENRGAYHPVNLSRHP